MPSEIYLMDLMFYCMLNIQVFLSEHPEANETVLSNMAATLDRIFMDVRVFTVLLLLSKLLISVCCTISTSLICICFPLNTKSTFRILLNLLHIMKLFENLLTITCLVKIISVL